MTQLNYHNWPRKCCINRSKNCIDIGLDFYKHAKDQFHNLLFVTLMLWYGILVILNSLGMRGHAHQKWQYQLAGRCLSVQKINFIPQFFIETLQRFCFLFLQTSYIGYFVYTWLLPPKTTKSTSRKLYAKGKVISHLFHEILQRYRNLVVLGILGMPGHSHQK